MKNSLYSNSWYVQILYVFYITLNSLCAFLVPKHDEPFSLHNCRNWYFYVCEKSAKYSCENPWTVWVMDVEFYTFEQLMQRWCHRDNGPPFFMQTNPFSIDRFGNTYFFFSIIGQRINPPPTHTADNSILFNELRLIKNYFIRLFLRFRTLRFCHCSL